MITDKENRKFYEVALVSVICIVLIVILMSSGGCDGSAYLGPDDYAIQVAKENYEAALQTPDPRDDIATKAAYDDLVEKRNEADDNAGMVGGLLGKLIPGGGAIAALVYGGIQHVRKVRSELRAKQSESAIQKTKIAAVETFSWIDEIKNEYPEISAKIDQLAEKHKLAGVQDLVRKLRSGDNNNTSDKAGEQ